MRNPTLVGQLASVRSVITGSSAATEEDPGLSGHWGRYACILVAGFVEVAIKTIYTEYVSAADPAPVATFAESRLKSVANPKSPNLVALATSFDPAWGSALDRFLDQDDRRAAMDTIMARRHLIAHGEFKAAISLTVVGKELDKIVEVLEFIEKQCSASTAR